MTPKATKGIAAALAAAACMGLAATAGHAATAEEYKKGVLPCMRAQAYDCAEKNWTYYLRLRPNDTQAIANLGVVQNLQGKHAEAIQQFEKAISMGEGTYDLFAYYADSLGAVGRTDEAIDWSYKTLTVMPQLVDVRSKLAKLLVTRKRHYEALSLLGSFDAQLEAKGQRPYFEAQRMAIETTAERTPQAASGAESSLRAPKYGDHFFAPVSLGGSRPGVFVVDTGAARTTVSEQFLTESKVDYKPGPPVTLVVADGRKTTGRMVTVPTLKVGPFELKQASILACNRCVLLLGQSTLSKFDLKSSKTQGVEFLVLSPRPQQ